MAKKSNNEDNIILKDLLKTAFRKNKYNHGVMSQRLLDYCLFENLIRLIGENDYELTINGKLLISN